MKTQLKNKTANNHSLCEMNSITYGKRTKIINIINDVKNKGFNIPRIEVRIVSGGEQNNCGYAYLKKNIIHIHDKYINDVRLTHIVLHELVHAIIGFEHDKNCPLMCPYIPNNVNEKKMWDAFKKYMDLI